MKGWSGVLWWKLGLWTYARRGVMWEAMIPLSSACEVQRLGSGMLRDIRLEGGGERLESHKSSCCVGLMARVRASRAYMCSGSSLVTTIWSAVSLGSVSGER